MCDLVRNDNLIPTEINQIWLDLDSSIFRLQVEAAAAQNSIHIRRYLAAEGFLLIVQRASERAVRLFVRSCLIAPTLCGCAEGGD